MADNMSRRTFVKLAGAGAAALTVGERLAQPGVVGASPAFGTAAAPMAQMPALDPQMQAVIDELVALEAPMITDMTSFNARQVSPVMDAVLAVLTKQNKPPLEPVFNVAHRLIPGGAGQQLLIRIYQPAGDGPFPALVYFHGGGWVIANLETYDATCRALTNAANCAVISVAYRQGPEYRYPAAHNDAFAAYQWVLANAASIRVDPGKVAIGGESAGGNLAAATTLMARDRGVQLPVHQMLVYPIANYGFDTASYNENAMAMPLNKPLMQWFFRNYLRRASDGASPYISLLRANTRGLPPATVITAQVDPLRDEGEAYGQKLKDAGVPVTVTRYDGVTHEFFSMGGVIDKAKAANVEAATALKQAFGTA